MTMYILEAGDTHTLVDGQPTQVDLKAKGEGTYVLRREDGSVCKVFTVTVNRRGNLNITHSVPDDLTSITTVNLNRTHKALLTAAKYWPAMRSNVVKVERELQSRLDVMESALAVAS